ncbi:MAG TPA: hypothetical protein VIL87_00120, partial [Dermatophilaceae bacterium]
MTDDTMRDGLFFAYPGKPDLRAETLREAADHLGAVTGVECETWEGLDVDGRLIIGRITEAIDRADTLVAEVGTLNSNVLFEVGYALARGKHIRLLIDETDATALRHWKDFGLLQSIGRIDYGGSAEILVRRLTSARLGAASERLWDDLVRDARPRDPRSVFYSGVPVAFTWGIHGGLRECGFEGVGTVKGALTWEDTDCEICMTPKKGHPSGAWYR